MNQILLVTLEEWRYWLRSKLAVSVVVIFAVLLIAVSVLNALHIMEEGSERAHHQAEAEETFLSQPDRHPHRMVHYGHYVFRTPTPLAMFDPGLDSVTGQSIFLEGHRQNSATFADSAASADLGSYSWLTPAMMYQLLAPLLVILLAHGSVIREREAGVLGPLLAQGTAGRTLLAGKALAILSCVALMLLPLLFTAMLALSQGESSLAILSLVAIYFLYLSIWGAVALLVSAWLQKRSAVLTTLTALWFALTLLLPSIAVNISAKNVPLAGIIETELTMIKESRGLSDGHNANHSDFDQLRSNLLAQYGVDRVEDLEVNIRGIVAQTAEENLTDTMNLYAENRMKGEVRQTKLLRNQGWLTPLLAVAVASRSLSGTDLEHHHRFLRQAEELRYAFVQGLNQVHAEHLSYTDDINRGRDEESSMRTRMEASNWKLLDEFRFETASAYDRLNRSAYPIVMLLVWFSLLTLGLFCIAGRLKP